MNISIKDLLANAKKQLSGFDTAAIDAELLLAHVLQINRAQLYARLEQIVSAQLQVKYSQCIARRLQGEPVAYIIGYREFWSLPIMVTPDTLIPRPETELLVECVLNKLPANEICVIADLGTGSGSIALAIAGERRSWHIVATDKAPTALKIARCNAEQLQINNVQFRQGDWCEALVSDERFDAIVTNPPYINQQDKYWHESVNSFEPITALIAQEEGLADLRNIIKESSKHLKPSGWLILEHGYDQGKAVQELLIQYGYKTIESLHDLAGIQRVAVAQIP